MGLEQPEMDSEILWDILKFPNWESGAAGFTRLKSGQAYESGKASGSQENKECGARKG